MLVVLLIWAASRCGSDDGASPDTTAKGGVTTTTTPGGTTASTAAPTAPLSVKVESLPRKLPSAHYQTGAAAIGGRVVLIGGLDSTKASTNVVWRFDPTTGATQDLGRTPRALHDAAVAAVGSSVFAFGGGEGNTAFDSVLVLKPDAANAVNLAGAKLPSPRSGAVAVTVEGGAKAVIVGGSNGSTPTNEVLVTTDGATFTPVAVLAEPVRYPAVAAVGSTVWVFGGIWGNESSPSIQKIDLTTGQASVVGQLPAPLSRASAFVLDGSVFIAGGRNANGRTADILRFDPESLASTPVAKLPQPITDVPAAVVGSTAYLLGGATPTASSTVVAISPGP